MKYKNYTIERTRNGNFVVKTPSGNRAFAEIAPSIKIAKKWIDADLIEKKNRQEPSLRDRVTVSFDKSPYRFVPMGDGVFWVYEGLIYICLLSYSKTKDKWASTHILVPEEGSRLYQYDSPLFAVEEYREFIATAD